jgi:hypothetical protein
MIYQYFSLMQAIRIPLFEHCKTLDKSKPEKERKNAKKPKGSAKSAKITL